MISLAWCGTTKGWALIDMEPYKVTLCCWRQKRVRSDSVLRATVQRLMRSDGRQHRVCFWAESHSTDSDLVRGVTAQGYFHCWRQQHRDWFRAECNSTETDSVLRATAQSLIVLRAISQWRIHCWGNSTESDLSWGQQHRVGFGAEGSSTAQRLIKYWGQQHTESGSVLRATTLCLFVAEDKSMCLIPRCG